MAVTTSLTSVVEYMLDGGGLPSCVGGGEDYRTLSGDNAIYDTLLIRGWAGDNISKACKIVQISLGNLETRIRTTLGTVSADNYKLRYTLRPYYGSVSGTTFNSTGYSTGATSSTYTIDSSSEWTTHSGFSASLGNTVIANEAYPGIELSMTKGGTLKTRAYFKNIKLTVTRTRACYITFEGDGITSTTKEYEYDTTPSYGSTPMRSGYIFNGWKSSANSAVYTGTLPTAYETDVTYTAQWIKATHTITTSAANGTVTGGGTYEYGTSVTLTATPNTGYKFVKWSDGVTTATRTVTVTGNATYTAVFEPVYVTYDSIFSYEKWYDSGITVSNGVLQDSDSILFGIISNSGVSEATATSPYFAVEAGKSYKIDIYITGDNWDVYIFFCDENGAWVDFVDSKNRFSSDGGGVSTQIFTAPSGSVKAQIRCDANGSDNTVLFGNFRVYPADCPYMSTTVYSNDRTDKASWSMPTPTREGYIFKGWNTKPDGSGTAYTSSSAFPADDLVLYSQWEIKNLKVIFKDEDGTILKTQTVEYKSFAIAPSNPEKSDTAQWDYSFSGWYDNDGNQFSPDTEITDNITYTARYIAETQKYTVRWFNEDGSILLELDENVPYGTIPTYNGETPTKDESGAYIYEHVGWSIDVTSSETLELSPVVESVEYYARFREIKNKYTVVWQNDDGTVLETDILVPFGTQPDYNGSTPIKESDKQYDYTFLGWSVDVNEPAMDDTELETVTGDIVYTAVYTKTTKLYSIRIVLLDTEQTLVREYGSTVLIEAPQIQGYRFVKWNNGNTDMSFTITVESDGTFVAEYEKLNNILANYKRVIKILIGNSLCVGTLVNKAKIW